MVLGAASGEFVAVARAVDVDADRGHGEPVEDSGGQGRITEVLAPLAELDIRREGGWRVLMTAIKQVEEHVRGGGFVVAAAELTEPDIVNDQPFRTRPFSEPGVVGLIGETRIKIIDQVDAPGVADADLALARTQRERLQDVALAGPALAGDQQIFAVVEEAERGEVLDEGAVEAGLEGPLEGLEGLADPQTAGVDPALDTALPELLSARVPPVIGGWIWFRAVGAAMPDLKNVGISEGAARFGGNGDARYRRSVADRESST